METSNGHHLTKQEILATLSIHKSDLLQKFPISKIGLFGSYARGDNGAQSDIDILVELREPMGWDFIDIVEYLEQLFPHKKIDLVSRGGIRSRLWSFIEKDLSYV